jgi:hypothetical protein
MTPQQEPWELFMIDDEDETRKLRHVEPSGQRDKKETERLRLVELLKQREEEITRLQEELWRPYKLLLMQLRLLI